MMYAQLFFFFEDYAQLKFDECFFSNKPPLISFFAACGHISCFWCVYNSMNHVHESNCPICRCPYNHFPSVCQLLHFLLLKLYPIAYMRRERQVRGTFGSSFSSALSAQESFNNL